MLALVPQADTCDARTINLKIEATLRISGYALIRLIA
jgi:hypothetical protein